MLNSKLFAPYSKAYSWYKFLLVYLLIAICFWLNLQCMSFTLCEISGTSMLSTLQHGQVVVVQTKTNDLDRGDIVVFDAGKDDHIKRIIGMPGDTIQVTRNSAYLSMAYVNSNNTLTLIHEPYIKENIFKWSAMSLSQNTEYPKSEAVLANENALAKGWNGLKDGQSTSFTVPDGYLFVLGDNRGVSEDSRAHGYVSMEAVVSKVVEMRLPTTKTFTLFGKTFTVDVNYVTNFKILRFVGLLAGYMGLAAIFIVGSPLLFDGGLQPYGKN